MFLSSNLPLEMRLALGLCRYFHPKMAASAQATSPGYQPRAASNALKEIVEDCMEELLRVYDERYKDKYGPIHPRVKKTF